MCDLAQHEDRMHSCTVAHAQVGHLVPAGACIHAYNSNHAVGKGAGGSALESPSVTPKGPPEQEAKEELPAFHALLCEGVCVCARVVCGVCLCVYVHGHAGSMGGHGHGVYGCASVCMQSMLPNQVATPLPLLVD